MVKIDILIGHEEKGDLHFILNSIFHCIFIEKPDVFSKLVPGRVAQSVGHLTRKSGVLGSIPGLATYFRFSFRFF